jgi:hypothetical protein
VKQDVAAAGAAGHPDGCPVLAQNGAN